jgi:hypothetical protein
MESSAGKFMKTTKCTIKGKGKRSWLAYFALLLLFAVLPAEAADFETALGIASFFIPPGADTAAFGNAWTATPDLSSNNPAVIAAADSTRISTSIDYGIASFGNNAFIHYITGTISGKLPVGTMELSVSDTVSGRLKPNGNLNYKIVSAPSIQILYGLRVKKGLFTEDDSLFVGAGYSCGVEHASSASGETGMATVKTQGNTFSGGLLYKPSSNWNIGAYYAKAKGTSTTYDNTAQGGISTAEEADLFRVGAGWQVFSETFVAVDYQHLNIEGSNSNRIFAGIKQGIIKDRLYLYAGWAGTGLTGGVGLDFKNAGFNIAFMDNPFSDLKEHLGRARFYMFSGYVEF